jgi:hypothetical protein
VNVRRGKDVADKPNIIPPPTTATTTTTIAENATEEKQHQHNTPSTQNHTQADQPTDGEIKERKRKRERERERERERNDVLFAHERHGHVHSEPGGNHGVCEGGAVHVDRTQKSDHTHTHT